MKASAFAMTRRAAVLAGILLVLVLVWAVFYRQIHGSLAVRLLLNSACPSEEAFFDLAKQTDDPAEFLDRCWATGKIPHRQLVAAFLSANALANAPWFGRAEPLVLAGAVDADESVRELALAILSARRSSRLLECAQAQLKDVDPMLRLLGLEYVRRADPQRAVPIVIPLLEDPDMRVVAEAEVALMRWSGEDYGVRARLAVPAQEGANSGIVDPANAEAIRRGVERRKEWWQVHAREYPPGVAIGSPNRLAGDFDRATPDFALKNISGRKVRLSDFRGKVVLLNFWATWCSACLKEIPDLIALQTNEGNKIAIIGVAMDGVPDEDGEHAEGDSGKKDVEKVQVRVARAVKARGINYPVLLDPHGSAGRQFNGGELPTTVILDAGGHVRRRFIGERSLKVFEAMVAEAQSRQN